MSIRDEARQAAQEYAQRHVGGMQPVETIGDRVRAAFEAGAVWRDEQADREPSDDNRVQAVRTGLPEVQLLACVLCGVLLWDIASHYKHSHGSCGHPNHGAQDHDCAPFLPDRELSADTGCPHEACEIDTAGNPTRCADCGNYLDSVPDREPSDAAVEAAARAMAHADVTNPDGWVMTEEARNVYSDMARAALIAAQEVRDAD